MGYFIKHIDQVANLSPCYFFDANLWLKILRPQINLSHKDTKYLAFVERFKNDPNKPKIIITAFLLSEVINRYLHDESFTRFCKKQGGGKQDKRYFKDVYRTSKDYQKDYTNLCDDIYAYSSIFTLVTDDLGARVSIDQLLLNPITSLDFNDHYYYLLAKLNNYPIVTDDGDFFVEDVEILTYNSGLIDKAKATVQIKK